MRDLLERTIKLLRSIKKEPIIYSTLYGILISRVVRIILILLVLAAIIFFVIEIPNWQVQELPDNISSLERAQVKNQCRRTVIEVFGGIIIIIGLYYAHRRVSALDRTVAVSQEGQITERFTRAIEQLGSEKLQVRLGALYALERVAKDSPKDNSSIIEIICAYVREESPVKDKISKANIPEEIEPPKPDIQTAINIIGRNNLEDGKVTIDLSRTYLCYVSFDEGNFKNVNLSYSQLYRASMFNANFKNASFYKATLESARFRKSNLQNANLDDSYLKYTDFSKSNLEKASISQSILDGARFNEAILIGADFGGSSVLSVSFIKANLENAQIYSLNLSHAKLRFADLKEADLSGSDFDNADLTNANLYNANLHESNLEHARGITLEQIKSALTNELTKIPYKLKFPNNN